ncbi:MAG: helix-turn-helix domain-containing protein [Phycisphaerales bacterium]|nr:helix-turn-helix domain-containing protein [Phycisphaerales bacterium]
MMRTIRLCHILGMGHDLAIPEPQEASVLMRSFVTALNRIGQPRALFGAEEAAQYVAVSPRTWARLVSSGQAPAPVELRGRKLWRRAELDQWISRL